MIGRSFGDYCASPWVRMDCKQLMAVFRPYGSEDPRNTTDKYLGPLSLLIKTTLLGEEVFRGEAVWCSGGAECFHVKPLLSNNIATPARLPHISAMLVLYPQHGGR